MAFCPWELAPLLSQAYAQRRLEQPTWVSILKHLVGVSQTCLGANVLSGLVPSTVFKKNLWAFLGPCVRGRGRPWYGTSAQLESHFTCSSPKGAPWAVPSTSLLNYFWGFLGALGKGEGAPLGTVPLQNPEVTSRKACLRNADLDVPQVCQKRETSWELRVITSCREIIFKGLKIEHELFFLKLFGRRWDIPAKSRDIPAKKFYFPGFEGHTELFGPPPPSCGRPLPHRKTSGLKSLGLCSFIVPDFCLSIVSQLPSPQGLFWERHSSPLLWARDNFGGILRDNLGEGNCELLETTFP